MEDNLGKLSRCLTEAGRIVSQITSGNSLAASHDDTKNPVSNLNEASSSAISAVGLAVHRARSMINHSQLRGANCRLNNRERLRVTNTSTLPASKRVKRETEKAFEFVLLKLPDEENSDVDGEMWNLSDDYIILRGFVNLRSGDKEEAVRNSLANAIQLKFPAVTGSDLEFIKANRRKLSKPVNCQDYTFQQIKLLAGQGCIYLKMKDGFDFLIVSDDKHDVQKDAENEDGDLYSDSEFPRFSADEPVPSADIPEVITISKTESTSHPCDALLNEIDEKGLSDPVEILRFLQERLVKGRAIDVVDDISPLDGETNYICVDRTNILQTTFAEFESINDFCVTFEVDFMGEQACDKGGPRKEWIRLMNAAISTKYFEHGLREYLAADYHFVGVMIGIALLQNGQLPTFLPMDVIDKLTLKSCDNKCITNLKQGLDKFWLVKIFERNPDLLHLLRPSNVTLSAAMLLKLLKPVFSPEGSTAVSREKEVYACFVKYIRQVASGRRGHLNLSSILIFITGASEEPVLGFMIHPTITFTSGQTFQKSTETEESVCFIPTAHTCTNTLVLPRGSLLKKIPTEEHMFELYDLAFSNNHFGIV